MCKGLQLHQIAKCSLGLKAASSARILHRSRLWKHVGMLSLHIVNIVNTPHAGVFYNGAGPVLPQFMSELGERHKDFKCVPCEASAPTL